MPDAGCEIALGQRGASSLLQIRRCSSDCLSRD